jgi:AcrR family transcriptional regulator
MNRPSEPRRRGEQRRGEELRRHVLFVAKDVFLESGYERASMDTVAARAGTSKRSLYAHFESKERLFLAVLDLVRELYLDRLRTPDAYADDPAEAVALFCGRFLQLMVWEQQVRTFRLVVAEAERLPASSRAYYDAVVAGARDRLAAYLARHHGTDPQRSAALADDLLGRCVLPRLFRTLLGVDEALRGSAEDAALAADVDLDAIRSAVAATLPRPA